MAKKKAKKAVKKDVCAGGCKFPVFPTILLVIGVLWLLAEIGVIKTTIPWWPVILILVALGMISHSNKKG